MDRLPLKSQNQAEYTDAPKRHSRRSALKILGALSVGVFAGSFVRPVQPTLAAVMYGLDANDPRFLPFPGKRQLLLDGDTTSQVRSSTAIFPSPPFDKPSIYPIAEWNTGHYPNYSDSAYVDGKPYVWVATFGDRSITQLDVRSGTTTSFNTGIGTLPLEVAYDSKRNRIVVASADDQAIMIVLDTQGNVIKQLSLTALTGLEPSIGGAQGVVVDNEGNYWFTLAYHDTGPHGVVVKIDGGTHTAKFVIKNSGLHNPNGIIFIDDGPYVLVLSDNGYAHQFDMDGNPQRQLTTINVGYRGYVHNGQFWVTSWSSYGEMVRIDLETEERQLFPCIPFANSVHVDHNGLVWVAGDAGLSVSNNEGKLLTIASTSGFANGLTAIDGKVFHATSEQSTDDGTHTMTQVAVVNVRSLVPSILSSQAASS